MTATRRRWAALLKAEFLFESQRRHINVSEVTYLMEEATPPRRIVEGCSVKEMSLASGGSRSGAGVASRKSLPGGICIDDECRFVVDKVERTVETLAKTEARKSKLALPLNFLPSPFKNTSRRMSRASKTSISVSGLASA